MNNENDRLTVIMVCEQINRIANTVHSCLNTIQKHEQSIKNMIQLIQIMRQLQSVRVDEPNTVDETTNRPVLYVD